MDAFEALRKKQEPDAQRLFQEAIMLFRQGKQDEGYAKYQEIVDKDYASTRYRNIKEQLKAQSEVGPPGIRPRDGAGDRRFSSSARHGRRRPGSERRAAGRPLEILARDPKLDDDRVRGPGEADPGTGPDRCREREDPVMVADGFKHLRLGTVGDVVLVEITEQGYPGARPGQGVHR